MEGGYVKHGECPVQMEAEIGVMHLQPRNTSDGQPPSGNEYKLYIWNNGSFLPEVPKD